MLGCSALQKWVAGDERFSSSAGFRAVSPLHHLRIARSFAAHDRVSGKPGIGTSDVSVAGDTFATRWFPAARTFAEVIWDMVKGRYLQGSGVNFLRVLSSNRLEQLRGERESQ